MVQHKRAHTTIAGHHFININPQKVEMKKPVELWQMVIGLVTFGIGLATIAVNTSNQLTNHESRIRTLEIALDKIYNKIDKVDDKQTQTLILLQNKQDRK